MRIAIVASHPIQYYAPLFRELAKRIDLTVIYAYRATAADQADAGFEVKFDWDIDLLSGYPYEFLENKAERPGLNHFSGVDTPNVRKRLRDGNYRAVLLMGWNLKCFHQALWAAKLQHIPVLVRGDSHLDTHRSVWKRSAKELAYPIFLRCFDCALAVGLRNRAYWRHYHYPESRIFDAPHCVDNDWFAMRATDTARASLRKKLNITPDAHVLLFAGKLLPFKRPLDLIAAAELVKRRGFEVEVLIAGSGPLDQEMIRRARQVGVRLHMLGFCNQSQMPEVYAASDLLVLPSDGRETWGLVVNESLACGRPIIVSDDVGCAPDMAQHLGDCSVFPVGDTRALASNLAQMINQPINRALIDSTSAKFTTDGACRGIERALSTVSRGKTDGLSHGEFSDVTDHLRVGE